MKNPFEEVIGGTLGNFSEKFIYSDRTCYVVTSTHAKVKRVVKVKEKGSGFIYSVF